MKRTTQLLALLVLVLAFSQITTTSAQAQTAQKGGNCLSDQLQQAAKAANVKINSDEIFSMTRGKEAFAIAPIAGLEQTPATELRKGVDIAFAYFATDNPKVPAGYYTLRAQTDDVKVGNVAAKIHLLDRSGKAVAVVTGEAEIHSLTVPASAASQRTFVTVAVPRTGPVVLEPIRYWVKCPNGFCVRGDIFVPRPDLIIH